MRSTNFQAKYTTAKKGMYGLPQTGQLANNQLIATIAKYRYRRSKFTPGLWKHDTPPIQFVLVVDDFGIKFVGKQHADHLLSALKIHYKDVSVNWDGDLYCGITLKWNYN